MRVLGITETCDLGSMYLRLLDGGHEVRVTVSEPLAAGTMLGLVPRAEDWREQLPWVREAGGDGLILFEAVGFGALQDELRREGFQVIGGSAFGDRLENDRAFAFELLGSSAMRIAAVAHFTDVGEALADLQSRPRRCVFKNNTSAGDTFVGTLRDGSDVAALLLSKGEREPFILMDHVAGIELGVGAYFNGDRFVRPACLDWEHKRFFTGDMGELTGEMGTVATFDRSDRIFEATLKPLEPLLREAGHVGYVNLNTIINADGVWPIEFTCRFGYPGFAVLEPLQAIGWAKLFQSMIARDTDRFETRPGFSVCIVMTTPPFPHTRNQIDSPVGLPVLVDGIDTHHLHLGEVGLSGNQLVTSGVYGWTAVITGLGSTVEQARADAYERAAQFHAPNVRYRLDIGERVAGELAQLASWGWLNSGPESRIASQIVR